jgi:hypothetical protein
VIVATCVADLNTPLSATSTESYEGLPCQYCGLGKCELICRSLGCDVACHARCFTVDQDKWPSVMGDYNGITLRKNDDCCGTWVCPEHVVSWVYSKLPGGPPPPDIRAQAVSSWSTCASLPGSTRGAQWLRSTTSPRRSSEYENSRARWGCSSFDRLHRFCTIILNTIFGGGGSSGRLAAVYYGLFFYFVVALLSKLVGLASVVCVPVSTVHRSSR